MVYLDLSFDGRRRAKGAGLRPRSGYKGGKKQPLSAYLLEKSKDDRQRVGEDINRLLNDDIRLEQGDTPRWAFDVNKEVSQSGETPLLINGFMSPCKVERPPSYPHTREHVQAQRTRRRPQSCRPATRNGVIYHRPSRTHEFLTSPTCLNEIDPGDLCLKHGRPTRTTLLRARQKNRPVPVNAYEVRRQLLQRAEERSIHNNVIDPKDILRMYTDIGDSIHSFLTGARYNRARCLDAKILSLYGIYMSRDNPLGCFLTHSLTDIIAAIDADNTPHAPPDSPRSDFGDELAQYRRQLQATYSTRHQNQQSPQISDRFGNSIEEQLTIVSSEQHANMDNVITEELIMWPDGLSPKSSRIPFPVNHKGAFVEQRGTILPTVHGVSMDKLKRMAWEDTLSRSNIPPPPTPMFQSKANMDDYSTTSAAHIEPRFPGVAAGTEITTSFENSNNPDPEKKDSPPCADVGSDLPQHDKPASVPKKKRKPKPVLVDRSVNVPSIAGDTSHLADASVLGTGTGQTSNAANATTGMALLDQQRSKTNSPKIIDSAKMVDDVIYRTKSESTSNKNQSRVSETDAEIDVNKREEEKHVQEESGNDVRREPDIAISEGISVDVKFHSNSIASDIQISEIGLDVETVDNKSEIDLVTVNAIPEQWKSVNTSSHDHTKVYLTEGNDDEEQI